MYSKDGSNGSQDKPPMIYSEMLRRLALSKNSSQLVQKNENMVQSFPQDKNQVFGLNSNLFLLPQEKFEPFKQRPSQDCYSDPMSGYLPKSGSSHSIFHESTSNLPAPVLKMNPSNIVQEYSSPSQTHAISYGTSFTQTVTSCQESGSIQTVTGYKDSDLTQTFPRYQDSGLSEVFPIQNSELARIFTSRQDRGVVETPQTQSPNARDGRLAEIPIQDSYDSRLDEIPRIQYSHTSGLAEIPPIQNSYDSRLDEIPRIQHSHTSGLAEIPLIQSHYDNIWSKTYPNHITLDKQLPRETINFSSFKPVQPFPQESRLSYSLTGLPGQHFENKVWPPVYDQHNKLGAGGNSQEIPPHSSSNDPLTEAIVRGISLIQQRKEDWFCQQSQSNQTMLESRDEPTNDLCKHLDYPLTEVIIRGISLLQQQPPLSFDDSQQTEMDKTRSQPVDEPTYDLIKHVNVFVLGSKGSGKKFLLKKFLTKFVDIPQNEDFSQGLTVQLKVNNCDIHATFTIIKNLCDCPKSIDMTCNGSQCCFVLVYNLGQTSSLHEVKEFVKKNEQYLMASHIPIILAGNTINSGTAEELGL